MKYTPVTREKQSPEAYKDFVDETIGTYRKQRFGKQTPEQIEQGAAAERARYEQFGPGDVMGGGSPIPEPDAPTMGDPSPGTTPNASMQGLKQAVEGYAPIGAAITLNPRLGTRAPSQAVNVLSRMTKVY
jgi:hypothetical protein